MHDLSVTTNATLHDLLTALRAAAAPAAVFGRLDTPATLKQRYRRLAQRVHPDRHPDAADAATEAFRLLQQWLARAEQALAHGGDGSGPLVDLRSPQRRYVGYAPPLAGDLCDLYPAQADDGTAVWLKIGRTAADDDLLQAEMRALRRIDRHFHTVDGPTVALRAHFPTLVDTLRVRDSAGGGRTVNVLADAAGTVTLAAVRRAYPAGLDAADMAWMFSRVLAALAIAHGLGIVHGAVTPAHVLVRPADHNGMLIDWCYSVPTGRPLRAVSASYGAFCPPEAFTGAPATPATDLYMAATCMGWLLGADSAESPLPPTVPRPVQRFLRACRIPSPWRRPGDAWELFDAWRELLHTVYGPPRFRPLPVPDTARQPTTVNQ